jgi:sterol desaturase/sphingolipid hydroxylase (fatty acid hydroxylase superfamily)
MPRRASLAARPAPSSAPAEADGVASKDTRSPSLAHPWHSAYWLSHFAFTWGLVILGVALAGGAFATDEAALAKKWLWLTGFAQLFVGMTTFILVGSCLVVVAAGACGRKQQTAPPVTPPLWREIVDSSAAMFNFAALAAWPLYCYRLDSKSTGIVWTLDEAQPWARGTPLEGSVLAYLAQLVLLTLVVDAYSYLKHKSMHSRALWQFHAMHHTYRDPTAFASFAVHPVEAFLTFVPVLGMMSNAMPVWAHAYAVWTLSWALLNLTLHCGHELPIIETLLPPLGINTSGFHNKHHEMLFTNYGELLYLWDVIFDTGFHPGKFGYGRKTLYKS